MIHSFAGSTLYTYVHSTSFHKHDVIIPKVELELNLGTPPLPFELWVCLWICPYEHAHQEIRQNVGI